MSLDLSVLPTSLKPIQHFLKIATEHENRDPVVAYFCRLYAMQSGMQLDKKSPEAKSVLFKLMDILENFKKQNKDNDLIVNEEAGHAYLENYALDLFVFADTSDRASKFGKNLVKTFYTAAYLLEALSIFGEISDELVQNMKYARWKAAYIHRCLKDGITPEPGPIGEWDKSENSDQSKIGFENIPSTIDRTSNNEHSNRPDGSSNIYTNSNASTNVPSSNIPPIKNNYAEQHQPNVPLQRDTPSSSGNVQLTPQIYEQAMKLCKFASSALQYEDAPEAILNLNKALKLLTTGQE